MIHLVTQLSEVSYKEKEELIQFSATSSIKTLIQTTHKLCRCSSSMFRKISNLCVKMKLALRDFRLSECVSQSCSIACIWLLVSVGVERGKEEGEFIRTKRQKI